MGGDIRLSEMKATYFPPSVKPVMMGAHPPLKGSAASLFESGNANYFQSYRNEVASKICMPSYEWGLIKTPYTPRPDIVVLKNSTPDYVMPPSKVGIVDNRRMDELNNFYAVAQRHREQYMDHSGTLHPLHYFKIDEYVYQCPKDLTSTYIKYPEYYTKYKDPLVMPLTLERTNRSPPLPYRALTGVYNRSSDVVYKR